MSAQQNSLTTTSTSTGQPSGQQQGQHSNYRIPSDATLKHMVKYSILEDKPILFDYWTSSLDKTSFIGVKADNEKLLVKSEDEYTSPIAKFFKSGDEYIIVTENSIYIVCSKTLTKKIR
jgi:hypothetical protein